MLILIKDARKRKTLENIMSKFQNIINVFRKVDRLRKLIIQLKWVRKLFKSLAAF